MENEREASAVSPAAKHSGLAQWPSTIMPNSRRIKYHKFTKQKQEPNHVRIAFFHCTLSASTTPELFSKHTEQVQSTASSLSKPTNQSAITTVLQRGWITKHQAVYESISGDA
jgi:hypothetical protein